MNGKKEGTGKDQGATGGSDGEPKRPYATLDLKATEISGKPDATPSASPQEAGKPTTGAKPGDAPTASAKSAAPAAAPMPGAGPGAKGRPDAPQQTVPKTKSEDPRPAAAKPGGSTFGSVVSHLAAGLVGGFIALLGADTVGPQLGLPARPGGEDVAAIRQRLAVIEKAGQKPAANADLAKGLAQVQARLGELAEISNKVTALAGAQSKLASETNALNEKIGQQGGTAGADSRLAKLEDRLNLIAAAAGRETGGGSIPQLSAITGKVADLEATLATQIAALRKGFNQEIDARLAASAESNEAAKSGAQRVDREVAEVKTEAGRLLQNVETLKADSVRNREGLRTLQEETGALRSAVEALNADVESKLKSVAKPGDVNAAIAPIAAKLSGLEKGVDGVVKSEADRKANAQRIVLALELANLKRAVDRGQGYAAELAEVRKAAGGSVELGPLDRYSNDGVPALPELAKEFRALSHAILDAAVEPKDASVIDRLISGAKSVVRVRKISHSPDDATPEASVARIETALKEARLGDVVTEAKKLPPAAVAPANDWIDKVAARHAVDRALAAIEAQLKTSLSGGTATTGPSITK